MKYILTLLLVAQSLTLVYSQSTISEKPVTPGTLHDQYRNLKSDLEVIDGVRMIKMYTMDKLWKGVGDSLQVQKSKVNQLDGTINTQQKEIVALNNKIKSLEVEKQELKAKVDGIYVLGSLYSKAGFVTLVSIVTVCLLALTGVLFAIGRNALNTSRELRKLNENLYQEFDTYKRHAVEKEIKISRELQNHRNKLAELKMA